jgi:hypothetical protein
MDKIEEYRRNCLQHVNRTLLNRLLGIPKEPQTDIPKKPGGIIKENSGRVKSERVNRWQNCVLAR